MKTKPSAKTIQVSPEAHEMVVAYCKKRGLKVGYFVSKIIIQAINDKVS